MAAHVLTTPNGSRRRRDRAGALDTRTRARLEAAVERLIAALDALDGDTDAEPDADCEAEAAEVSAQRPAFHRNIARTTFLRRAAA